MAPAAQASGFLAGAARHLLLGGAPLRWAPQLAVAAARALSSGAAESVLHFCVVGTGPAGMYTADKVRHTTRHVSMCRACVPHTESVPGGMGGRLPVLGTMQLQAHRHRFVCCVCLCARQHRSCSRSTATGSGWTWW